MSRCFPFPPPGYEKKLRVEGVTLLAKEKDKEKKHKKDKDKEKKEGREKDKESSKDRYKEKDKEKHKHKDNDKKNGKKRSRHEKSFEGDRSIVEKVGSSSPQSSCLQEPEQRISFVDGATGSQTVHRVYDQYQRKSKLFDGVVASRSNGACGTEGSGLCQMVNGQSDNIQSDFSKVAFVFSNGAEQRTVQTGRPIENHNNNKKGEKSKDKNAKRQKGQVEIYTPKTFGYNGTQIDQPKEAAFVKELERRIRDDNGATGSQVGTGANVSVRKKAQNPGKMANGYAISFSQTKENSRFGNGSYIMENGQKDNNEPKVPKVGIVNNFKVGERGCEVAGAVEMRKKAPVEELERNGYSGRGVVDSRKKIQSKDDVRNKSRENEKVKEEADNSVKLSIFAQNGSASTDSSKQYTFKMGTKTAEAISGKRKEPEANGILHDNETRPNKWQKTVRSSQPVAENGRHLKLSTTITLPASKQGPANDSSLYDEHRPSWTMGAQSPPVTTKSPSASMKPIGTSLLGSTKPQLSIGKVPEITGSQESFLVSAKPPLTGVSVNGTIRAHETVGGQESAKPALTIGKVNGIIEARRSLAVTLKRPSTSGKEKHKDEPSIGKVPENTGSQESSLVSAKPSLTGGNINGTIGAHGSPPITTKAISHIQKAHGTVGGQDSAKPALTEGKVKEKRKDKSSSKPVPPHPDTKYLSQILSVPKMEELSEFDDQEWLFESKKTSSKEGDLGYDKDGDGGELVWAKAICIESVDVYALPYVIPY